MQEIRRNQSLKDLKLELLVTVFQCMSAGVLASAGERDLTNATGLAEWLVRCHALCKITVRGSICRLWL